MIISPCHQQLFELFLCFSHSTTSNSKIIQIVMVILQYLPVILLFIPAISVSAANISKPNCIDGCRNISIPFPFGTTQDCYKEYNFWVVCNQTFNPPKLLWQDNPNLEITDISDDGQMRLLRPPSSLCYDSNGQEFSDNLWVQLPDYFTVNNTANRFTMVSCDAAAVVSGERIGGGAFRTGCTATCGADDVMEGSCMGLGCCQTSIPRNVRSVEFELNSLNTTTNESRVSDCSYAFVVEDSAFNFSLLNLTNLGDVEQLPMVVDWVVESGRCDEAKKNETSYACTSANSVCQDYPNNGDGYRCRCDDGYQGNPYLHHGCEDIDECANITRNGCLNPQSCRNTAGGFTCSCDKGYSGHGKIPYGCKDINECADSNLNDCTKKDLCNNIDGDYICSCPKGSSGNGRGRDGCKKYNMKIAYIVIGVSFGVIFLMVTAMAVYLEHKRRSSEKTKQKYYHQNGGMLLEEKLKGREGSPDMVKIFSSIELKKATNDFHKDLIVGQGGFGTVYKGFLSSNQVVAIKKSKRVDTDIETVQFINEVFVLSQVNHRNIVRLLGCCLETEVPLLVYEYINNGTLSSHLHNQAKARFLNWETRLKIATEAAGVLSYLHSAAATPIIHRDVKSDNILLDLNFTAKVSDFGASKLVPLDQTQLMTVIQGTFGYLDPEYMQTHQLTEKSDVYSFGVVLLELLTGRMAISNNKPEKERNLVIFFLSVLKQGLLFEILDENIMGDENMEEVSEVANLAKVCLSVRGEERPSMKEVAMELEGLIIRGKHKWERNVDNAEEMESLLEKGDGPNYYFANGDGNSSSVGYDSIIRDHVVLPISGGR